MAGTIGSLEGAARPELTGVWTDLCTRLRRVQTWDGLQPSSGEGIGVALADTPNSEKGALCGAVAISLSKAAIADPDGDFQKVNAAAHNWLQAAKAIANSTDGQPTPKIGLPSGAKLKLELLQQLSELDTREVIRNAIRPDISPEGLSSALSLEISGGRFPRTQAQLVSLLSDMKVALQWPPIIAAFADRLRVLDVSANETEALIGLLLAARSIARFAEAQNTLKDLSTQGHLSNLIQLHKSTPNVVAKLFAATILGNPAFERPNQVGQSAAGDSAFTELAGAQSFESGLIKNIAGFIKSIAEGSLLFELGATNQKIARLAAALLGGLTRSSYKFALDPKKAIEHRKFLETHDDLNPVSAFLGSLNKPTEILGLLSGRTFRCRSGSDSTERRSALHRENKDPLISFFSKTASLH